jgi:rare lipoprotein A
VVRSPPPSGWGITGQCSGRHADRSVNALQPGMLDWSNRKQGAQKETPGERNLVLKHNRVSCNRRILRNVLMASALTTVLAAGVNIRPASAHARHGVTRTDGTHHAVRIGAAGAWRHDHQERRGVREKLLASLRLPGRHVERSAESGHSFEGSGIASVYSDHHTASGEQMDPADMTAAHRTLPFGTKVTVVNRRNGRSAVVRINDRGPFVHGRVIDLSPAAARVLGVDGLAPVSLIVGSLAGRESRPIVF